MVKKCPASNPNSGICRRNVTNHNEQVVELPSSYSNSHATEGYNTGVFAVSGVGIIEIPTSK
jgi:hypothetical protein